MRRRIVLIAALLLLTGCATSIAGTPAVDPTVQVGWSARAALSTLPATELSDRHSFVSVGDLDAATDIAGVERPSSADDIADWALAVTNDTGVGSGPTGVAVPLPAVVNPSYLLRAGEFADELGWSVLDVSSYAEIQGSGPAGLSVLSGDFDAAQLTAAMGEPVDGIWRVGPEQDDNTDLTQASAARPLGQSLRLALSGDELAVSSSTPPVQNWLTGPPGLDTDPTLAALASALDAQDVYAAIFQAELDSSAGSFDSVAVGAANTDGTATLVIAYHYGSAADAAADVDRLRTLVDSGSSALSGRPWSELLADPSVTSDGDVVTLTAALQEDTPAGTGWKMLYIEDNLVVPPS